MGWGRGRGGEEEAWNYFTDVFVGDGDGGRVGVDVDVVVGGCESGGQGEGDEVRGVEADGVEGLVGRGVSGGEEGGSWCWQGGWERCGGAWGWVGR